MNRRGGAWIAIICILIVGVSVTKMTKRLVSSEMMETAVFTSVMEADDAENWNERNPAGIAERSAAAGYNGNVPNGQASQGPAEDTAGEPAESFKLIPKTASATDSKTAAVQEAAGPGKAKAAGAEYGEAEMNEAGFASEDGEPMELGGNARTAKASDVQDISAAGAAAESLQADTEQSLEDGVAENGLDSGGFSADAARESAAAEAIAETVKSPLDPVIVEEKTEMNTASSPKEYTYEELLGRLEAAKTQSEIYQSALNDANPGAVYIAAEQEWNLWDKELNLIYTAIRSKMSEEEAEALKREEIEWIKERDLEADKGMLRSNNQLGQNTDYIRISAAKTKERCYELIADYEEALNRTGPSEPQNHSE